MRDKLILFLILLTPLFVDNVFTIENSHSCYFDGRILSLDNIGDLESYQNCELKTVTIEKSDFDKTKDECEISNEAESYELFDHETNKEKFQLSVLTGAKRNNANKESLTALNVTISDITFHRLTIRLKNVANHAESISQTIEFNENNIPNDVTIFLSTWEYHRTKMEIFANKTGHHLYKEFHFIPPGATEIKNTQRIEGNRIFGYVDTTIKHKAVLNVQQLPDKFNITTYNVKFLRQADPVPKLIKQFNLSKENLQHQCDDFSGKGIYRFVITPIDDNGENHTASLISDFCMMDPPRLFIMIVGLAAIPIVIFLFLYLSYTVFSKKILEWVKTRKPNCLIVSPHTHDLHTDVVVRFVEYLRRSDINAMIDVLDIPNDANKDPGHWLDDAFRRAHTIIVMASPPAQNHIVVSRTPYRTLEGRAYKLIHENRRHPYKQYLALDLPYCKLEDMAQVDAVIFRRFKLIEDLEKIVNKIHNANYIGVAGKRNSQELREAIKWADNGIRHGNHIEDKREIPQILTEFIPAEENNEVVIDVGEENERDDESLGYVWDQSSDEEDNPLNLRDIDLSGENTNEDDLSFFEEQSEEDNTDDRNVII